jgi:hypothetical protein
MHYYIGPINPTDGFCNPTDGDCLRVEVGDGEKVEVKDEVWMVILLERWRLEG